MIKRDPFKYFKTSPEIIRLAVMLYVRFPQTCGKRATYKYQVFLTGVMFGKCTRFMIDVRKRERAPNVCLVVTL